MPVSPSNGQKIKKGESVTVTFAVKESHTGTACPSEARQLLGNVGYTRHEYRQNRSQRNYFSRLDSHYYGGCTDSPTEQRKESQLLG